MTEKTELYHHGVKGQKWGVRRYQNKDGRKNLEKKSTIRELSKLNSSTPVRLLRTQFISDIAVNFIKRSNIENQAVKDISVALVNAGRYWVIGHIGLDAYNDFKNNK